MELLMKLLSIGLRREETASKLLLIAIRLINLLAIPLGCQSTTTKCLVMGRQTVLHSQLTNSSEDYE